MSTPAKTEDTSKYFSKLNKEVGKVEKTEQQNLSLEKLTALSTTQDYANCIYSTLRMDTSHNRDILCRAGNHLMKIDETIKRITRIAEKQAARK